MNSSIIVGPVGPIIKHIIPEETTNLIPPTAISNLEFWFDSSDASKFTLQSGNVQEWANSAPAGVGKNLVQNNAAAQPGKTGNDVTFDGTQWIFYDDPIGNIMNGVQDFTIVILGRIQPLGSADQYFLTLSDAVFVHNFQAGTRAFQPNPQGVFVYRSPPSGSGGELFIGGSTNGNLQSIVYRRDHTGLGQFTFWVDSVKQFTATTTVTSGFANADFLTAGSSNFDGSGGRNQVGATRQIIVYSKSLSDSELSALLKWVDTKR